MEKTNKANILILLGGTGFVGRAVAEKYLRNGWQVIVIARSDSINRAKEKMVSHGFDSAQLEKFADSGQLVFVLGVDLRDRKWVKAKEWSEIIGRLHIDLSSSLRIFNLTGQTSGSAKEIMALNVNALSGILALVDYLKLQYKDVFFCNMGSTAERKTSKNLSPYEMAKKIGREMIDKSKMCDYHFVANYIKGRGEQKMTLAAPYLWAKLKFSHKWLFGFKVSVVDVDDLADIMYYAVENIKPHHTKGVLMEVNVTSGEMTFGKMVENLLPQHDRVIPPAIFSSWPESCFLKAYAWIAPRMEPCNQLVRRLADFARRGATSPIEQDKERLFKTAGEIKELSRDNSNYSILLGSGEDLIVRDKNRPLLYVLREKKAGELEQIVQRSVKINPVRMP